MNATPTPTELTNDVFGTIAFHAPNGTWKSDAYHAEKGGNGKPTRKTRTQAFKQACNRVRDNLHSSDTGYVITDAGLVYEITTKSKMAKLMDPTRSEPIRNIARLRQSEDIARNAAVFFAPPADGSPARLEYLRRELREGRISYDEIGELQGLGEAGKIPADDVELREAAGLPEDTETDDKTQHTPGPWNVGKHKTMPNSWQIESRTESPIFTVLCGRPEAQANARLIAAAPELLGVAQWMLEQLDEAGGMDPEEAEALNHVRSVIAKAVN